MRTFLHIKIAYAALSLLLPLCSKAQSFPESGSKQWRWVVDFELPDSIRQSDCIDLSNAPIIESYEERYKAYGDSLLSRQAKGAREWFVMRDDGLWRVGWNDRITRHSFGNGIEHEPFGRKSGSITSDTVTVTAPGSEPYRMTASSSLDCGEGCFFVFADADTVRAQKLVAARTVYASATDTAEFKAEALSKRWYAPGCPVPIVEWEECKIQGASASSLTICPPSEQRPNASAAPRKARSAQGNANACAISLGAPGSDSGAPSATAEIDGDIITIRCPDSREQPRKAMLCDLAGRILRQSDGCRVDASGVPAGAYLACALVGSRVVSAKIWIERCD